MPSGGGSQNSTVTNTTQLPSWAQPYAQSYLGDVNNLVNQDLASGYPSGMNEQVAPMTQLQQMGLDQGASAALGSQSLLSPVLQNVQATQSGAMLNPSSNPYLAATANAANQQTVQQYQDAVEPGIQAQFAQAGSFGGSAQQNAENQAQSNLAQALSNSNANIYNQNYQQGLQDQIKQQALLPTIESGLYAPSDELSMLGGQQQQQDQSVLNANTQNATNQFNYPYQLLSQLGGALPTAVGGTGSSNTVGPNSNYIDPLSLGLAGTLGAGSLMAGLGAGGLGSGLMGLLGLL